MNTSPFDPDANGYCRAMASGHLTRHGHPLVAHYEHDEEYGTVLVRECCGDA